MSHVLTNDSLPLLKWDLERLSVTKFKIVTNAVYLSGPGKCKRIARHLLFLLWFSWRCKFAEVFAKSTTSKENKANNDLFTFWIRGLFTSAKLHDKLLWLIGGVVCVYTSQLNGTGFVYRRSAIVLQTLPVIWKLNPNSPFLFQII